MRSKRGELDKIKNKRGQVTIFIIVAVLVVALGITVYVLRDRLFASQNQGEFSEVYTFFEGCVKKDTLEALKIAGGQGGYIEVPEFKQGSQYAPFSSQLDFLGTPVPYWYYVSANGIVKEQVPSKSQIESQLEDFLDQELKRCDFSDFVKQGISVETGNNLETNVKILDNRVLVGVSNEISASKGDSSSRRTSYDIEVVSKFGKFYNLAREIYEREKKDSFLENYSVDVMYNYAPVTGSELSCAPKIWKAQEVVDDIRTGLSANIGTLKIKGDYYDLKKKENKYFIVDEIQSDEQVNFMYNPNWPTRIEIWPADGNLLISEPVGLQQGMGIIGFCYVPYHFVYDIYYPVLIQVYDQEEIFQFPVSVVVDKSVPRQSLEGESVSEEGTIDEICNYKNTRMDVYTYDAYSPELDPIESDIDFVCFNTKCLIGKTEIAGKDAKLSAAFPQCINGKIIAKAEGYLPQEVIVSTNEPNTINVPLSKLYELELRLIVSGQEFKPRQEGDVAVINFESEKNSFSVALLSGDYQGKKIKLGEGLYNVSIQVFSGSSLTIPGSSTRQCVDVPASGLLGFFGKKNQQCFDVSIPSQTLSNALSAGGKIQDYILNSDLKNANKIEISIDTLPAPSNLDQLQQNYELYESARANLNLR
ncbi:hypothetical protein HYW74_02085 [Candidatus Pacearchaeota archaeon]|nr:hypothetical protein [Candidatus Pacearchaeota archaeon]